MRVLNHEENLVRTIICVLLLGRLLNSRRQIQTLNNIIMKNLIRVTLIACIALTASCSKDDEHEPVNTEHTYKINASGWLNENLDGRIPNEDLAVGFVEDPTQPGTKGLTTQLNNEELSILFIISLSNDDKPLPMYDGDNDEAGSYIQITFKQTGVTVVSRSGQVTFDNLQIEKTTSYSGLAYGTLAFNGQFIDNSDEEKGPLNITGEIVVNR